MFRRILAQYKRLVVFVAAAYGGAIFLGVLARRPNTALYSSVIILLVAVFAGVHLWIGLPDRLLWALAILGLFHLAGGLIPLSDDRILYNLPLAPFPLQLDRLVHAFGSAVVALVAWHALRPNLVTSDRVPWAAVVLVGAAGMGVAAIEEVAEFASVSFAPSNVGGYSNTGWDLVFNLFGCLAAAVWVRRRGNVDATVATVEGSVDL